MDAGRWFHPSVSRLKVPTLDEIFQLIRQRQRKPVTIALNMKVISPDIEEKIVKLVEKHGLFDQLFAFGQPAKSSRRFKRANPKFRTTIVKIYDCQSVCQRIERPAGRLSVGRLHPQSRKNGASASPWQASLAEPAHRRQSSRHLGQGPRQPDGRHLHRLAVGMPRVHWRNDKTGSHGAKDRAANN